MEHSQISHTINAYSSLENMYLAEQILRVLGSQVVPADSIQNTLRNLFLSAILKSDNLY
jgi:hypothetical protein